MSDLLTDLTLDENDNDNAFPSIDGGYYDDERTGGGGTYNAARHTLLPHGNIKELLHHVHQLESELHEEEDINLTLQSISR